MCVFKIGLQTACIFVSVLALHIVYLHSFQDFWINYSYMLVRWRSSGLGAARHAIHNQAHFSSQFDSVSTTVQFWPYLHGLWQVMPHLQLGRFSQMAVTHYGHLHYIFIGRVLVLHHQTELPVWQKLLEMHVDTQASVFCYFLLKRTLFWNFFHLFTECCDMLSGMHIFISQASVTHYVKLRSKLYSIHFTLFCTLLLHSRHIWWGPTGFCKNKASIKAVTLELNHKRTLCGSR